jgi:hypothetical protein
MNNYTSDPFHNKEKMNSLQKQTHGHIKDQSLSSLKSIKFLHILEQ